MVVMCSRLCWRCVWGGERGLGCSSLLGSTDCSHRRQRPASPRKLRRQPERVLGKQSRGAKEARCGISRLLLCVTTIVVVGYSSLRASWPVYDAVSNIGAGGEPDVYWAKRTTVNSGICACRVGRKGPRLQLKKRSNQRRPYPFCGHSPRIRYAFYCQKREAVVYVTVTKPWHVPLLRTGRFF